MSSGFSTWFYASIMYAAIPFWAIVSKISKNLVIDGIIFDTCVMLGFFLGLFYIGETHSLTIIQWIGLGFAFFGLLLLKLGT